MTNRALRRIFNCRATFATAKMIAAFFPLKKLRRNVKHLLLGAILLVGAVAVYHEMVAAKAWNSDIGAAPGGRSMLDETYKGRANLHVFEDWCGSSTADLRKNPHYPLYPHSRTTVQKLAITPRWTNYGLRVFGYLHPYTDGDFVFALSSDDNSEFWLSSDDTPVNLQLLAWVGKTGTEWTAPGEFEKYASQNSRPVRLSSQRRYFFEVIHKQNDRGTDHVEVAWQLLDQDLKFWLIESEHISLYTDESALLVNDVAHIPQTAASHRLTPTKHHSPRADMLRHDPRDAFYRVHLINSTFLGSVLPDCSYRPSYTIKGFPLLRYQGLQFVHMSYVYPNDHTRLTHMEKDTSCFYPDSMKRLGFSRHMKLDRADMQEDRKTDRDFGFQKRNSIQYEEDEFDNEASERGRKSNPQKIDNSLFPDYGDDYDDYVQKRRRKLLSFQQNNKAVDNSSDIRQRIEDLQKRQGKDDTEQSPLGLEKAADHLQAAPTETPEHPVKRVEKLKSKRKSRQAKKQKVKQPARPQQTNQLKAKQGPAVPSEPLHSKQNENPKSPKINRTEINHRIGDSRYLNRDPLLEKPSVARRQRFVTREKVLRPVSASPTRDINQPLVRLNEWDADTRKSLRGGEVNMPRQQGSEYDIHRAKEIEGGKRNKKKLHLKGGWGIIREENDERDSLWGTGGDYDNDDDGDDDEAHPTAVFDLQVNWNQTFQVDHLDLHAWRSDMIELRCGVSGNLLLHSTDALPIVQNFMDNLNEKHHERFKLVRVINVVKRLDRAQGSRYLLELEVKDVDGQLLRLSHYIYALNRNLKPNNWDYHSEQSISSPVLCNPVGFRWNPTATVHFIVPVKNQGRWVHQLIVDIEELFRETRDINFNLIITDFNSTDMDVRKALEKSSIPRYQYVKMEGNFERAAGLQAGIDLIMDVHSIVFLCDLHLNFPSSIIDSIRKHTVEGYMAFAPIVMRLECGSTPLEANGLWEVNGFGLLGIYKSDLDRVGGMNTEEFKDRWGGEDWELLDRILQAGMEVDRIYLRNFFHRYHSKRGMWNRRMTKKNK
ncbi:beta-1,4-N-acetylgalactosaminyltransferase 3 isoform X2 [Mugil cephalus]|uniref:beta-1,4-N-acetylgalactosaminyltransferase 3 isoform X2 n=1 Tax=Mugil cephalus TaxID=48193 RepID=UPI001FB7B6E6|nr:beta-1,4-N-acetylgalactosaminyltransferase 3 isoform X2 [Mugil cephalus]